MKSFFLVFIVIHFSIPSWVFAQHEDSWNADEQDKDWNDFGSWSPPNNQKDECICLPQSQSITEEKVALLYFKKFVSQLFHRKKLQYSDESRMYHRSLTLSILPAQLDKLEQLQDARDLDNILMDIFENEQSNPNVCNHNHTSSSSSFTALLLYLFRDLWQLTQTSEIRFLIMVLLAIFCGWVLHKRYRIGCFALLGGGLFLFGYLHTYLECNREMEAKEMMEILRLGQTDNTQKEFGFFGGLKRFFSSSTSGKLYEQEQMIKKSSKVSLGFCRPDHVLIIYFNDIFLKYIEVLLEKCTLTLTSLHHNLPFPYNMFAGLVLVGIIGYILKLTFKYILSPAAWCHIFNSNMTTSHNATQPAIGQSSANDDRLSGDNLKMILNVLKNNQSRSQPIDAASGVEEVVEAIEPPPADNKNQSAERNTSKVPDKNYISKDKKQINEVTLEDLPNDDLK